MQRTYAWVTVFAVALSICLATAICRAAGSPSLTDQSLAERGAYLARVGDCEACHSKPGGASYAGGAAIISPFGPLYAPNLTPNPERGIGAWSDDDFYRAMHEGIGRQGQYLYPAFPYQWFTKVTREDVLAIRAFLKTVPPSSEPSKPNRLMFPFDVRAGLGPWNALYFRPGVFQLDPSKSESWNRGAYLVQGLGHCADCHTPKGLAMEPKASDAFSGGSIDNWYAPNITSDPTQGIGRWSEGELVQYFKTGATPEKGVVAGPMAQVVHDSLSHLTDSDLQAIAAYVKSIPPLLSYRADRPSAEVGPHASGENVYVERCSFCHQMDGRGRPGAVPALAGNGVVQAAGPEDVIRVILGGNLATGTFAPMPPVGAGMTDQEIADVTDYVRTAWSNAAPVIRETGLVGKIRAKTVSTLSGPGGREENNDPCLVPQNSMSVPSIDDPQVNKTLSEMNSESMLQLIPALIARVKEISPDKQQADIINGLMLAYCRIEARNPAFLKPQGRDQVNRFGQLVYSQLASKGRE